MSWREAFSSGKKNHDSVCSVIVNSRLMPISGLIGISVVIQTPCVLSSGLLAAVLTDEEAFGITSGGLHESFLKFKL